MKVLVIFTGGTIGSTWSNGFIGLDKQSGYPLLSLYSEYMKSVGIQDYDVEFVAISPYQILSENNTGEVLKQLAVSIREGIEQAGSEGYQGILVTHGTDTLAYSAALAGYLFADSPLPIVFVSANYVLSDSRSNGLDNFRYAIEFIRQQEYGGVFVSYRNMGDLPRIHLATRVLGHQAYSDDVYSVGGSFACFDEHGIRYTSSRYRKQWGMRQGRENPFLALEEGQDRDENMTLLQDWQWDAPVLQIHPAPGMRYPDIPSEIKAVLHHSYHAGTICSETPGMDLFFEEAGRRQIPVFLTGADPEFSYDSTRIFDRYGIHVLPKASPVSMYVKLWLLVVSGRNPVEWMDREMAGEFIQDEGSE